MPGICETIEKNWTAWSFGAKNLDGKIDIDIGWAFMSHGLK